MLPPRVGRTVLHTDICILRPAALALAIAASAETCNQIPWQKKRARVQITASCSSIWARAQTAQATRYINFQLPVTSVTVEIEAGRHRVLVDVDLQRPLAVRARRHAVPHCQQYIRFHGSKQAFPNNNILSKSENI